MDKNLESAQHQLLKEPHQIDSFPYISFRNAASVWSAEMRFENPLSATKDLEIEALCVHLSGRDLDRESHKYTHPGLYLDGG